MPPRSIVLTRLEAIDVMVAVGEAAELLEVTDCLGAVLQLEDSHFLLFDRLYPQE